MKWFTTWHAAAWELMHGDMATGERLSERAFEIGQGAGVPDAVMIYGGQLAFARVYEGRGEEIIDMLEQSVSAWPRIAAFRAGLASVLCWLDRRVEAAEILKQASADGFHAGLPAPTGSLRLRPVVPA